MITIERVGWDDVRAPALRQAMDAEMGILYGPTMVGQTPEELAEVMAVLALRPEDVVATVLALDGDVAVGHAALRWFGDSLEVKKVVVDPRYRGQGISKKVMLELEDIAREMGVTSIVLQTGDLQVEAIGLYERLGYTRIPVYGAYGLITAAVCFEKTLV
ncbi:GNAT family N-acetyltransferase [Glaciihabitans sp. dw_435]|uniref:GNAT family N-acetyltransferase n=1 Tax=Glaciihabitans sp. dw_435 TaxID=2720081 RepID=UPI001BD3FE01|nr:GNAT family N-acetyltransferase [Glaciihabitans sp. dw_435]